MVDETAKAVGTEQESSSTGADFVRGWRRRGMWGTARSYKKTNELLIQFRPTFRASSQNN